MVGTCSCCEEPRAHFRILRNQCPANRQEKDYTWLSHICHSTFHFTNQYVQVFLISVFGEACKGPPIQKSKGLNYRVSCRYRTTNQRSSIPRGDLCIASFQQPELEHIAIILNEKINPETPESPLTVQKPEFISSLVPAGSILPVCTVSLC
jgi:hypothetical protein